MVSQFNKDILRGTKDRRIADFRSRLLAYLGVALLTFHSVLVLVPTTAAGQEFELGQQFDHSYGFFETEDWGKFEEIVNEVTVPDDFYAGSVPIDTDGDGIDDGTEPLPANDGLPGNYCYRVGNGTVGASEPNAGPFDFDSSLLVWANGGGNSLHPRSNHVIAQKRLSHVGQEGIWRYELYAKMANPAVHNGLELRGQTGPEFSVHNTKFENDGAYWTYAAGIQYLPDPGSLSVANPGDWAIWVPAGTNGVAGWTWLMNFNLDPGVWYFMSLTVDLSRDVYKKFILEDASTLNVGKRQPLVEINFPYTPPGESQIRKIGGDKDKFNEESFSVSLEAENQETCGDYVRGAPPPGTHFKVYYDNVRLLQSLIGRPRPVFGFLDLTVLLEVILIGVPIALGALVLWSRLAKRRSSVH